mmetsp:Transcript_25708/g.71815  ORF Transcript_25708/g.71815 Transcript_25708/m.71815 type:complete len:276 (-) Transcript_25708:705-1532(-)
MYDSIVRSGLIFHPPLEPIPVSRSEKRIVVDSVFRSSCPDEEWSDVGGRTVPTKSTTADPSVQLLSPCSPICIFCMRLDRKLLKRSRSVRGLAMSSGTVLPNPSILLNEVSMSALADEFINDIVESIGVGLGMEGSDEESDDPEPHDSPSSSSLPWSRMIAVSSENVLMASEDSNNDERSPVSSENREEKFRNPRRPVDLDLPHSERRDGTFSSIERRLGTSLWPPCSFSSSSSSSSKSLSSSDGSDVVAVAPDLLPLRLLLLVRLLLMLLLLLP